MLERKQELQTKIRKEIVRALNDYHLMGAGDRVMVATSGGKDSSLLLMMLKEIQKRSPYRFEFEAVMLDQKQPGFCADEFGDWVRRLGIPFTLLQEDTYSIVKEKVPEGKTYCSLCSRLRRGILYNYAFENGFSKIALGHHRDDIVETALMNLMFSGKFAAMPPKLLSDDKRNLLIRPMCYVAEADLQELAQLEGFPIVPCNLCGSQDGLKRQQIKRLLQGYAVSHPDIYSTILAATKNVRPSQLLDDSLWDFQALGMP